jgi:hypothetical protein
MTLDAQKYILTLDNLDLAKIMSSWTWLIGNDKTVVALTKAGDAIIKDNFEKLYFLDVGCGELNLISDNYLDFTHAKLKEETMEELLLPGLVDKLERENIILKPMQVYSYTLLPILGGKYDENNMYTLDIYEHYNLTGDLHYQLKDNPDGTRVDIEVK